MADWVISGRRGLGPVKVLCPSVGECQGQEVGVGGLVSKGSGEEMGVFRERDQERP